MVPSSPLVSQTAEALSMIDDRRFGGKTVCQRLQREGLIDRFGAALAIKDEAQLVQLLEQVLIVKSRALVLAQAFIAVGRIPGSTVKLDLEDAANAGIVARSKRQHELGFPPCMLPDECPRDPYLSLGSHPDIVERLWDELGQELPVDCRAIVFGIPALIGPRSGVVLAQAFGTAYALRLSARALAEAARLGAKTSMSWSGGQRTELGSEYGPDWIFGGWFSAEAAWCREVYEEREA